MAVTQILKGKKYVIQRGTDIHGFKVGTVVNILVGASTKETYAIAEDGNGHQGFIIKSDVELKK